MGRREGKEYPLVATRSLPRVLRDREPIPRSLSSNVSRTFWEKKTIASSLCSTDRKSQSLLCSLMPATNHG